MYERPAPIPPDRLRAHCDPSGFSADSTADVEPDIGIIGQPRAAKAIEFYKKALQESENNRVKQIFAALIQVETDHLKLSEERLK